MPKESTLPIDKNPIEDLYKAMEIPLSTEKKEEEKEENNIISSNPLKNIIEGKFVPKKVEPINPLKKKFKVNLNDLPSL